jgi:hypothetical protein
MLEHFSLRMIAYAMTLCIAGIFCFSAIENDFVQQQVSLEQNPGDLDARPLSRAVIIEPRDLQHALPLSIKNVCEKTGVPIVFFHSDDNLHLARSIQKSVKCPVHLKHTRGDGCCDQSWYNRFTLSVEFWSSLGTDGTVLLFQSDSGICGDSAKADIFARYDLCGASWGWAVDSWRGSKVGNGGFTIRNVPEMIRLAKLRFQWGFYLTPVHLRWAVSSQCAEMSIIACTMSGLLCSWRFGFMKGAKSCRYLLVLLTYAALGLVVAVVHKMNHMAEDTYFSNSCAADPNCVVCPHKIALDFCEEGEANDHAWAFHNNWAYTFRGWTAAPERGPLCNANDKIASFFGGPELYLDGGPTRHKNDTIRAGPMGAVDAVHLVWSTCSSKVNIGVLERGCYMMFGAMASVVCVSGMAAVLLCIKGAHPLKAAVAPSSEAKADLAVQLSWSMWCFIFLRVCVESSVLVAIPVALFII